MTWQNYQGLPSLYTCCQAHTRHNPLHACHIRYRFLWLTVHAHIVFCKCVCGVVPPLGISWYCSTYSQHQLYDIMIKQNQIFQCDVFGMSTEFAYLHSQCCSIIIMKCMKKQCKSLDRNYMEFVSTLELWLSGNARTVMMST